VGTGSGEPFEEKIGLAKNPRPDADCHGTCDAHACAVGAQHAALQLGADALEKNLAFVKRGSLGTIIRSREPFEEKIGLGKNPRPDADCHGTCDAHAWAVGAQHAAPQLGADSLERNPAFVKRGSLGAIIGSREPFEEKIGLGKNPRPDADCHGTCDAHAWAAGAQHAAPLQRESSNPSQFIRLQHEQISSSRRAPEIRQVC
jgi:hypothetical protein